MSGKTARIIAWIMLIAAVSLVGYACAHPEASFPWGNQRITYGMYVIYIVIMIVLFVSSFKKK